MTKPINPIPAVTLDILTRLFVGAEADVADPTIVRALAGQRVKESPERLFEAHGTPPNNGLSMPVQACPPDSLDTLSTCPPPLGVDRG